jgi:hypothetical protein
MRARVAPPPLCAARASSPHFWSPLTRPTFPFPLPLVTFRHASGTPLSVLDPAGSTTIEQAYKNIDEKLKVSD